MGKRMIAMILNGLGFIDDRLYMFPQFLENKPIDRLFGPDITADYFNDDALGRCLDVIHDYGSTLLFSEIAFEIATQYDLLGKTAHMDSTSLSVYGDYADPDIPGLISYGYSKDQRPDLKQVLLTLGVTGKANFPIWMSSHNGNASDKITLQRCAERLRKLTKGIKDAPAFIFVGDSAMYEKCVEKGGDMLWLSRVPNSHKKAKELLATQYENLSWSTVDDKGYQVASLFCDKYKGVKQRWTIVFSQQMHKRESITLEKKKEKEYKEMMKKLNSFKRQQFSCEFDALKAMKILEKRLKYYHLHVEIKSKKKHANCGRPKADSNPVLIYFAEGSLTLNTQAMEWYKQKLGRFILATNQLDVKKLSDMEMLREYKNQTHVETGFRFIKGNCFEVSSVFLKKSSRVEALMMVMTLCLMIYSLAQYSLRDSLNKNQDTLPNQLKKEIAKPTIAWIFRLFNGVSVVHIRLRKGLQTLVSNITPILEKVIRYFGPTAMKIYDILETNNEKVKGGLFAKKAANA